MIALLTDFGTRDAYVAQLKGAILSIHPHVRLVDLTHDIEPFQVREAAYVLDQATRYFPPETIFVAVVDPGVGTERRPLLLRTRATHTYVGPDNGLFTWVIQREGLADAYVLEEAAFFLCRDVSTTFHGRDIFGPVAAHLALGVAPSCFGPSIADVVLLPQVEPHMVAQTIQGEVVHIDRFGNVVSNISARWLADLHLDDWVKVAIAGAEHPVPFCVTYGEAAPKALIGLINSQGSFELAMSQGRASDWLGVRVGDSLTIERLEP